MPVSLIFSISFWFLFLYFLRPYHALISNNVWLLLFHSILSWFCRCWQGFDVIPIASPGSGMVSGVATSWHNTSCGGCFKNCFLVRHLVKEICIRKSHILSWHHVFVSISIDLLSGYYVLDCLHSPLPWPSTWNIRCIQQMLVEWMIPLKWIWMTLN